MTCRWRLTKKRGLCLLLWYTPAPSLHALGVSTSLSAYPGRYQRLAWQNTAWPKTTQSPQMAGRGIAPERKGWHHGAQDTDLCQLCPASRGWSHGSLANGRGRDPGVLGRPAQSSPQPPPPPAPGHRGGSRAGAGGRGGRSEGGRGRREPSREGGGGVGREKKKENIFRVPACGVSVRFGRKCVGYFGAVTWAGGLQEAPGLSQPRAVPP